MKIKYAEQITLTNIEKDEYDLIIASSGYESRATCLVEKLKNQSKSRKIYIGFKERKEEKQRKINDGKFLELGFVKHDIEAGEGNFEDIIGILDNIFTDFLKRKELNVFVDYSCMTKVWYSTIINYFSFKHSVLESLQISFGYTPAKYSKPKEPMPNQYMGPIPGVYRISASNKPIVLVIGLGYEKYRAKGLVEHIDPEKTFVFYSKPAFDEKYVTDIEQNNSDLLVNLDSQNIHCHPVNDLISTESQLTSLYHALRDDYKIILAPQGPKPFALLCILLAHRYPDIDIWRVSAGGSRKVYDREPSLLDPIICKVVFENVKTKELAV
ncbi:MULTISPECIES: hypothetical protein [Flavobacteriaceae]|uniref:hypothetical protein n=1 Tax=Flavobacteriaceae TaxID=49546 RepID=UPI00234B2AED|nr:hypothetical protein [Muricauda sp. SP22]MDC6362558.1 hypothetical protein [Muricauda sp. SP22]